MKVLFVWPNKDPFGFKIIGLSLLSGIARSLGWKPKLFATENFRELSRLYRKEINMFFFPFDGTELREISIKV